VPEAFGLPDAGATVDGDGTTDPAGTADPDGAGATEGVGVGGTNVQSGPLAEVQPAKKAATVTSGTTSRMPIRAGISVIASFSPHERAKSVCN
jgi:hypothetical protein